MGSAADRTEIGDLLSGGQRTTALLATMPALIMLAADVSVRRAGLGSPAPTWTGLGAMLLALGLFFFIDRFAAGILESGGPKEALARFRFAAASAAVVLPSLGWLSIIYSYSSEPLFSALVFLSVSYSALGITWKRFSTALEEFSRERPERRGGEGRTGDKRIKSSGKRGGKKSGEGGKEKRDRRGRRKRRGESS